MTPLPAQVVILGAGGHAASLADVLEAAGSRVIAVAGGGDRTWDVPVLADDDAAVEEATRHGAALALGIGDNRVRLAVCRDLRGRAPLPTVVAPSATLSPRAELGVGVTVLHQAHVGPAARLGDAVVVNTAAVVEHDCRVGDGAHIAPGACLLGAVSVGNGTFVGAGARVLPGVRIGDNARIGAGAVVTSDVASNCTVVGVPATVL